MCPVSTLCEIASTVRAKRERRKEARPGELIEAALTLFVEKGYAGTRVEEVAQLAGVSKGTLFLYFSTKEDLFKAVVRENISGRFVEWGEELLQYSGTSADLLRYCMVSWWERVGSTRVSGIPKLMMSEGSNFPELAAFYEQEVIRPGEALIRKIFERGMASGEFKLVDLQYANYLVLGPLLFLTMARKCPGPWGQENSPLDPLTYIHLHVDTLLGGLLAKTSA
jgi:TetR/AcrR family transcriptional regulator